MLVVELVWTQRGGNRLSCDMVRDCVASIILDAVSAS